MEGRERGTGTARVSSDAERLVAREAADELEKAHRIAWLDGERP